MIRLNTLNAIGIPLNGGGIPGAKRAFLARFPALREGFLGPSVSAHIKLT